MRKKKNFGFPFNHDIYFQKVEVYIKRMKAQSIHKFTLEVKCQPGQLTSLFLGDVKKKVKYEPTDHVVLFKKKQK